MPFIRFVFFVSLFSLLPFLSSAQSKADQVKSIRQTFQFINSDQTLKKITLLNEAFTGHTTDGGSELTGFYKNGKLVKMREWIGLSDGNKIVEYYFKDGVLIFVYGQFNAWVYNAKQDAFDHSQTKTIFEGRYYFNQQKIIEQKVNGNMHADDEAYYSERSLLATASHYALLLSKKK